MNLRRTLMLACTAITFAAPLAALAQAPGASPGGAPGTAPGTVQGTASATPAGAGSTKIWRVGFLAANKRPASIDAHHHGAFARGMRELGYVEGKNLTIEYRYAENRPELLDVLAAELVKQQVDVMVIQGSPPTQAAQRATSTIPLVFVGPGDPVRIGLVKSLARPGGNTTGLSSNTTEISGKRLQLLLEMTAGVVPKISRVAVLTNPHTPAGSLSFEQVRLAAEKLGVALVRMEVSTPQEIDNAFAAMKRDKAGAVYVPLDAFFEQQKDQIAQLALQQRLPCMAPDRMYAQAGCLMSYGGSLEDLFRYAATYVDKIFKGRSPAELPVEQPTQLELFINGKTAKALGLKIPQSLLISAERVIE